MNSTIFIPSHVASMIYSVLLSKFSIYLELQCSFKNFQFHIYIDICFQNQGIDTFDAFQFHLVNRISQGCAILKYNSKFSFVINQNSLVVNLVLAIIFHIFFDNILIPLSTLYFI